MLVILLYAGKPYNNGHPAPPIGELLVVGIIFGAIAAVFGRRFWRLFRRSPWPFQRRRG